MKISVKHLLATNGIHCVKISQAGSAGMAQFDARAAFVTETTVEDARRSAMEAGEKPEAAAPDLRYGDVLVSWKDGSGHQGVHASAGQDAGIHILLTSDAGASILPFTGMSMVAAHDSLIELARRGSISDQQQRVLQGIQGVYDVVMAAVLEKRFPDRLTGMVFASKISGGGQQPIIGVEPAAFARHAQANMIRARISAIDPDHPEAAMSCDSLEDILERVLGHKPDEVLRQGMGAPIDEALLRRIAKSTPGLSEKLLGALSRTPPARMSARAISTEDMALLARGISRNRLSGAWVDEASRRLDEIGGSIVPGTSGAVEFFTVGRRDILAMRDSISEQSGSVFLYSWPSYDRIPASKVDGEVIFHVSREEIPAAMDVARLRSTLDELDYGPLARRGEAQEEDLVN